MRKFSLAACAALFVIPISAPNVQAQPARERVQNVIVDFSVLDRWPAPGAPAAARAQNTDVRATAPTGNAKPAIPPSTVTATPPAPPPLSTVLPEAPSIPELDRIAPAAGASTAASSRSKEPGATGDDTGVYPLLSRRYYENYVRAPVELFSSPLRWTANDWGVAALVAGGFAGMLFADKPIRDFIQNDTRSGTTDKIASFGADVGSPSVILPATAAALAVGAVLGERREVAATMEAFQSLVLTLGITEGIKLLARRQRPNENPDDSFRFDGPGSSGGHKSLPSGHASGAFALASSLALNYPDDDYVAPIAYTFAGLVSWSRLNDDRHWATDVLFGGGLGFAMSYTVNRLNAFGNRKSAVAAGPYLDGSTQGIQVTIRF
jgi:membrane-associated phospholipid phosphatase